MVRMSARAVALETLRGWPGAGSVVAGRAVRGGAGLSYRHAVRVWQDAREVCAQRAGRLARGVPRGQLGGMVELDFIGVLGGHLGRCGRCWDVGRDLDRPADWLLWAVRQRQGLEEVLLTVTREMGVGRLRALPPGPVAVAVRDTG